MPNFASDRDLQQAQQLMQPALIRIIDNIRKQLEANPEWAGSYASEQIWPEGASPEEKAAFNDLQQRLNGAATPEEVDRLEQQLAQLPKPMPIYALQLKRGEQTRSVDLWQLCYQACFRNYAADQPEAAASVDLSLLTETGEVDWDTLDEKAKVLIQQIFAGL
ncbi:MAG: hypothetical protein AAGF66_07170 [Cyanobacteria bacterium P01_H01_bin.119]